MSSVIEKYYRHQRHRWHEQRADLFIQLMRPEPGARVLDLGGGYGDLMERLRRRTDLDITIADISDAALASAAAKGFHVVPLREGEPLPFHDKSFDIVFCNSVIEHVTLPKAAVWTPIAEPEWARASSQSQHEFAHEIARIGRGYFVQTPHRAFPIDSHTWLPFVGWLSHNATIRVVRVTNRYWVKHCSHADWQLLGTAEMRSLFPEAEIHIERVVGIPKSLIAYLPPPR
jgi:SAM-dependent methyltransferase